MKVCGKCKLELSLSEFQKDSTRKNGIRDWCRNCCRLMNAANRAKKNNSIVYVESVTAKIEREKILSQNTNLKWCAKGSHFVERGGFSRCAQKNDGLSPTCKNCKKKFRADNAEKIKQAKREYGQKNKAVIAEKNKQKYQQPEYKMRRRERWLRNLEKYRNKGRDYYYRNREKCKLNSKFQGIKRRARLKQAQGSYTPELWREKLKYFNNCCYLCGKKLENEIIHQDHRIPLARGGANWIANIAPACPPCNYSKNTKTEKEFRQKYQSV